MFNIILAFITIRIGLSGVAGQDNNVCGTFKDYYTIKTNDKCWYDVAAEGSVREVIETNGYPFEEHKVTTKDGYILTIYRIPNTGHPSPKPNPVFLQHGLLADASTFIGLNNNSLAFILSDVGYDVWLANCRGTTNSEGHVFLTTKDKKFWDHSLDELGLIDVPTMINYVRDNTGRKEKVIYVGHSLGTTLGMIYGSALQKEAKENIKLFLMMAPAHKLTNMISPYRSVVPFSEAIMGFISQYDLERIVSQGSLQKSLVNLICRENPKVMQLCVQLLNQFYGPRTEIGTESLPVIFNLLPAGASIKVIKHISDFVRDKFQKYDYGLRNNEIYGQPNPPEYNVKDIKVPVYVMYTVQDWATSKEDAINFYNSLSKKSRFGLYEIGTDFNHMDFLFGRYARKLVYNQILNVLNRIENKP